MTTEVFIYVLKDPRTGDIRYVGQTRTTLKSRLSCHLSCARTRDKVSIRGQWIRELLADGVKPIIEEIDKVDLSIAEEKEREWIAHFRENGHNLINIRLRGRPVFPPGKEEFLRKKILDAIREMKASL